MLISLGFLLAVLLAFIVAPAYWGRAVRLTTQRLRHSLPMNESEIRADRDRLRAQHAIHVHKLATAAETARISMARQKVEINRRDAKIGELERTLSKFETNLEARNNALHVLEQVIMDRVPRVEKRLDESRDLISQRDGEIASLQSESNKTFRALEEAMEINLQQRLEMDRLKSSLASRHERAVRGRAHHAVYEGDIALRAEAEALRARTREQAAVISKLQEMMRETIDGADTNASGARDSLELSLSQIDLSAQMEENVSNARSAAQNADATAQNKSEMKELQAKIEIQGIEIEKLNAALKVFEEDEAGQKSISIRDMRIRRKSRIAALEKETAAQTEIIRKLRAELASTNDRIARQSAHHAHELRRLGAGTHKANLSARQRAQARNQAEQAQRKQSLTERIVEKIPAASADLARTPKHESKLDIIAKAKLSVVQDDSELPDATPTQSSHTTISEEKISKSAPADTDTSQQETEETPEKGTSAKKRTPLLQRISGIGQN